MPELREWWLGTRRGEGWGAPADAEAGWATIRTGASEGVLWHLAADTLDFVDAASETLPTDITLGPGLAPAPSGLIYGVGSVLPQLEVPVPSMAWAHDANGIVLAGFYRRRADEPLAMGLTNWPWGDSWHQEADQGATLVRRQIATIWLVAQTPRAVTSSDIVPSRPQARRAARANLSEPTVRVFDLRGTQRDESEPVPDSTPGQRYRHRWGVRPHWRQQAYGPGRAYRKAILVPFHVKGPEGAPFLAGDKVYVMRPDDPDAGPQPTTSTPLS